MYTYIYMGECFFFVFLGVGGRRKGDRVECEDDG